MSGEQECRKCDGERTHPMTDAMPCDWCGGSGVEPMNAPQSDTDPKEFVPSGCDCGNCDKPSGTDPTSDPIGGASGGHDELVERLANVARVTDPDPQPWTEVTYYKRRPDGWAVDVLDAYGVVCSVPAVCRDDEGAMATAVRIRDALAAAGTAPTPPTVSADLLERIRERTVSSALEGADPLMVDLYAALTAAPTAPAVDVTALPQWAELMRYVDRFKSSVRSVDAINAAAAAGSLVDAVRAQGVPSTDPLGGCGVSTKTAPAMTEADWQQQFVQLAKALGWHHMHVRRSLGRGKKWVTATNVDGWPDLTLWHPKQQRVIFVELKSAVGRLTDDQKAVLTSLSQANRDEVYVLRPDDLELARRILAPGWKP